jgi:raffinose/stachyose/melibiose transport system permease protein
MNSSVRKYFHKVVFVFPALLLFLVFVIYPFISSIHYSFTQWDGVSKPVYIGLGNYTRLFTDSGYLAAIKNTFLFSVANVILGNPLSLLLALLLNRPMIGRGALRTIFYLPAVLSLMVVSIIWGAILNYSGPVNEVLKFIGMGGITRDWLSDFNFVMPSLILILIWQGTGYGAIIYLAGLQSISPEVNESAEIDGAVHWTKFRYITLPLLMPSVTIVTFLGLSRNLKIFDLPYIMTNGGPGNASVTLAMKVYTQAFRDSNFGYATASGLVLFLFVLIVSFLQISLTSRREVEL